jgi:hypothetical protein
MVSYGREGNTNRYKQQMGARNDIGWYARVGGIAQ